MFMSIVALTINIWGLPDAQSCPGRSGGAFHRGYCELTNHFFQIRSFASKGMYTPPTTERA